VGAKGVEVSAACGLVVDRAAGWVVAIEPMGCCGWPPHAASNIATNMKRLVRAIRFSPGHAHSISVVKTLSSITIVDNSQIKSDKIHLIYVVLLYSGLSFTGGWR
jgi:hypothetical protein